MATSDGSKWLNMFRAMSTGMRKQMVINPPATLDKPTLFRTILNLPSNERNALIPQIPKDTLKTLIRSLPPEMQQSVYKALLQTLTTNKTQRDKQLKSAINTRPYPPSSCTTSTNNSSNSVPSGNDTHSTKQQQLASHSRIDVTCKSKQIQLRKRKPSKLAKLHKLANSKTKTKEIDLKQEFETVSAISDYEEEHDRIPDACSRHINFCQFNKEYFLSHILKMQRAFGDAPQPSRYSALIILNHIKSYLQCVVKAMQQHQTSQRNSRCKPKYFEILKEWYPAQVQIYMKFINDKKAANQNNKTAPDLVNDENENEEEAEDDASSVDSDEEDNQKNSLIDTLRKEQQNNVSKVYIDALSIDIGWGARLMECDQFTSNMDRRAYFKFTKCRETSLTSMTHRFYKWLDITPFKDRKLTRFLGFLGWDRIGCIIQIARNINQVPYGQIIECNDDLLKPTVIVKSILFLNTVKESTPDPIAFDDKSFVKVDVSHIKPIENVKKEKHEKKASGKSDSKKNRKKGKERKKKEKKKVASHSGRKRKLSDIPRDADEQNVAKKRKK